MTRLCLALCLVPAVCAADDPPKRDLAPQPPLSFKQDGDDLVVTTSVRANGSAHVLLTGHDRRGKDVVLRYTLLQNRDRLVRGERDGTRSLKEVQVEWRLKGQKKDDTGFKVEAHYLMLTTAELEQLEQQVGRLLGKRPGLPK